MTTILEPEPEPEPQPQLRPESASRIWAVVSLVVLSLALVVSVALLTPWAPSPPLGGDDTDLLQQYFSPSQIARSETFHDDIKWPSWLGLSTSLVLALALGFSPVGRRLVDLVRDRQWRWGVQVTVLVA